MNYTIQNIADSNGGFLEIDHILIAVAFWALLMGMVGVYRSISSGGAAAWVRIGLYGMIIATTLRSVFLAIDGVGLAMVVEQWEGAMGAGIPNLEASVPSGSSEYRSWIPMRSCPYGTSGIFYLYPWPVRGIKKSDNIF